MSLINEALKRARTAQPTGPAAATAAGPALHPVETGGRGRNGSIFTLPFVVTLVVMLACVVLWAWYRAGRIELVVRANTSPAGTPVTMPAATSSPMATTPAYRLEGIFFRPNRPEAVINGQTVYVGSRLDDARVMAIDHASVTIVTSAGQTNLLALTK
jgi:hypothetical protein